MRTLGLLSPEHAVALAADDDDGAVWMEDESSADLVLVGGADVGAESSEEEPLASVISRTASSATARHRHMHLSLASSPRPRRPPSPASDSDDCLPQPARLSQPARLPAPARRLQHTVPAAANAPLPAPAVAPGPSPPDYSSLSLAALQRKAATYGFRPSKERSVLERQLADVWRALHPAGASETGGAEAEVGAAGSSSSSPAPKKTRGRKKKVAAADEDEVDGPAAQEDGESVGEKLRRLVIADEGLYLRILRYEVRFAPSARPFAASS